MEHTVIVNVKVTDAAVVPRLGSVFVSLGMNNLNVMVRLALLFKISVAPGLGITEAKSGHLKLKTEFTEGKSSTY